VSLSARADFTQVGDWPLSLAVDSKDTMDVSGPDPSLASAIQFAVQKQMLDGMKAQAAGVVSMIASAPKPSANLPGQGTHIDAFA
jgi:hypothetical protein